jgi:hypothetical protein
MKRLVPTSHYDHFLHSESRREAFIATHASSTRAEDQREFSRLELPLPEHHTASSVSYQQARVEMDAFDDFLTPESNTSAAVDHITVPSHGPAQDEMTIFDHLDQPNLSPTKGDDFMTFLIDSPISVQKEVDHQAADHDSFFDDIVNSPKQSSAEIDHLVPVAMTETGARIDDDPFAIGEISSPIQTAPPRNESPLEQDFLSWLDDSNPIVPSSDDHTTSAASHGVMDDFFEEVFGEKSSESLRQNSTMSQTSSASGPSTPNNFSTSANSTKRFDSILRAEASSAFPDLSRIRDVIFGAGYLPQSCRGQVWSVLLSGSSGAEDQEAEFWRPSGRDENIENYAQLRSDCEALVKRATEKLNLAQKPTNPLQCKDDLHDILLLACIRRKAAYRSLLCDILSPLIFVPAPYSPPSRALSSSCFYSLSNTFIPLINLPVSSSPLLPPPDRLQATAYSRAIKTVHSWLHILLSYHFPALTQHLDRVYPGWESAIQDASPSEVSTALSLSPLTRPSLAQIMTKRAYDMKSADLDRLERELGLVSEDGDNIVQSSESEVISSARPSDRRVGGCVSSLWLCGIFGGCVPALYSCWLTDWMILQGGRYAGEGGPPILLPSSSHPSSPRQGYSSLPRSLGSTQLPSLTWMERTSGSGSTRSSLENTTGSVSCICPSPDPRPLGLTTSSPLTWRTRIRALRSIGRPSLVVGFMLPPVSCLFVPHSYFAPHPLKASSQTLRRDSVKLSRTWSPGPSLTRN